MTHSPNKATEVYWPNSLPNNPVKRLLRVFLGKLFSIFAAPRAQLIRQGKLSGYPGFVDRQIIAAWAHRCRRKNRPQDMSALQQWFWREQSGTAHHQATRDRFWAMWEAGHSQIFAMLISHVEAHPGTYNTLVEIGCGEALLMPRLRERLPGLDRLIGLDLSPEQVERNSAANNDPDTSFEAAEATSWALENAKPQTVYLTIGGVLEYFSQTELLALIKAITRTPVAIALLEPVADDLDSATETESRPFGQERTFSHSYASLLESQGFEIDAQELLKLSPEFGSTTWTLPVACKH